MLYSVLTTIPETGVSRLGTVGGSPFGEIDGNELQLGHILPPRKGLIRIDSRGNSEDIFNCSAIIEGYYDKEIANVKVPGRIIVELPCSVTITGPEGLEVLVEAWDLEAFPDRGACSSIMGPTEDPVPIPTWASSFDLSQPGTATFTDTTGAIVGVVIGGVVNFSIPARAANVAIASETANISLVFRQQG